jgi:hypothetical protein
MPTEILAANGAGNYQQWEQSNVTILEYQNINQTSLSGAGSNHIHSSFTNRTSTYNFADTSAASGNTINSVTLHVVAKEENTGAFQFIVDVEGNGTFDDTSGVQALTTTLTEYTNTYNTNPDTSNAWTSGEIDSCEFGVKSFIGLGRGNKALVYAIWVVVDYVAPGYGNSVMGVDSGNISEVIDVPTANISKINGV